VILLPMLLRRLTSSSRKHLSYDYLRKRLEWTCENTSKAFDCEMDFMYWCGIEC
jgi:hypothetical protein